MYFCDDKNKYPELYCEVFGLFVSMLLTTNVLCF